VRPRRRESLSLGGAKIQSLGASQAAVGLSFLVATATANIYIAAHHLLSPNLIQAQGMPQICCHVHIVADGQETLTAS
jgi:hypothetical protein